MNILLFSRYGPLGASSRQRSYQFLAYLKQHGIHVTVSPLFGNRYLKRRYEKKSTLAIIAWSYANRFFRIASAKGYDLVWIEKELLPWLPSYAENYLIKKNVRYVVDYDDAIFHKYDKHRYKWIRQALGHKIDRIMRNAHLVITGNRYLAERAKKAGAKRVKIIPTVVDLKRYPKYKKKKEPHFTIGWVGSPTTAIYLKELERVLTIFCGRYASKIVVIGSGEKIFNQELPVKYIPWTEENEAAMIAGFDVGIMPLPDNAWVKGKCGYKLIQYMASGCPVIASRVNAPLGIVKEGVNGYLVDSPQHWLEKLEIILLNPELAKELGKNGRQLVAEKFNLRVTAPYLTSLFFETGLNHQNINLTQN